MVNEESMRVLQVSTLIDKGQFKVTSLNKVVDEKGSHWSTFGLIFGEVLVDTREEASLIFITSLSTKL